MTVLEQLDHTLVVDDHTVWLQANRLFGCMVPELCDQAEDNCRRAIELLGTYTNASQIVRIKPKGLPGFIDLDERTGIERLGETDGLITTNPEYILHANPADCGEIALTGFGMRTEKQVVALIHASRRIVDEQGHLKALDYMCSTHDIDLATMTVRLSPSSRAASYAFPQIDENQKASLLWKNYIEQDEAGLWHVDFHERTVNDLIEFGVPRTNMYVSEIDTGADTRYFSHLRYAKGLEANGANGLLYALRPGEPGLSTNSN